MSRYGQKPENALKRANEFIEVGKPARALDTLQEIFRNKRWTYNWSESVLEPIMFKYLDLCVQLQKSHIAKEGLFQYRNMCQSVNVGSLINVIKSYLRMAEEKTDQARQQSKQAVVDIDDLDNLMTPESILLSAVSGEDAQDRSDRTILAPWVKFLWESYCQCLELLRTNSHVETLYHEIARLAFKFCLEYNRKTEFRKLCDKLRKHLEDINKLPRTTTNVTISKLETQQLNLETRLVQLDSAIEMELWHEAYKVIEDIYGLMNLSKKMLIPKTMANYYQKLSMVFWKADNHLFHAAALFKLFQLSRDMKKNLSPEEQQRMANRVLLATLSIPLPSAHPEFDRFIETDKTPQEKIQKLAVLLGLSQPPSRVTLLKNIVRLNVVSLASKELQDLYNSLEVEFSPLQLCEKVDCFVKNSEQDETSLLLQYVPTLKDVTLVRLVHQVSQIYQTIQFERLLQLAKFSSPFHLERLLVDCVRYNDMQVKIDHAKKCVHFGIDLTKGQRDYHPDGPILQPMPSEEIRCQLLNMATVLHHSNSIINPEEKKQRLDKSRAAMVDVYHATKAEEHERILGRQKIIEQRKEYIEHMNNVREEEETRQQEELQRKKLLEEQARLEVEREDRERKRQQFEIQQIKERHLKEKMQQISLTSHGQKILKKLDEEEIKKMDAEQIAEREAEELQKERREAKQKLKTQEKKMDYLERAKRLEEIPLAEKANEAKLQLAKLEWDQQQAGEIQAAIEERKEAVLTRERLSVMREDADKFLEGITSERNSVYLEKMKIFETKMNEERAKRLLKRKLQRKIDRKLQFEREKAEAIEKKRLEEQRVRDEEERKIREEERAKVEEEEKERRLKDEAKQAEHLDKLEKQAEIRRRRELEIERKLEEEKSKSSGISQESSDWRRRTMDNERGNSSWRNARDGEARSSAKPNDRRDYNSERDQPRRYDSRDSRRNNFQRGRDDRGRDDRGRNDRGRDDRDRLPERRGFGNNDESRSFGNWRNANRDTTKVDADRKENVNEEDKKPVN